ncbi:MAG: Ig-like domain-containing protein [Gemmatimonadota bacterium]
MRAGEKAPAARSVARRPYRRLALLAGALASACATANPPPGGEQDRLPPRVIEVSPEPGSSLRDLRSAVVFKFDERISERGIEGSILVSPRAGEFKVDKGGSELRVRQDGGWSPGVVYRVTLLPGVADLFGNARAEAVELVFSTGPEVPATVLGGVVSDRMTGQPVAAAAVAATPVGDTVPYVAMTDEQGFFAIRFLPEGAYDLRALRDGDGDWTVDAFEPRDERAVQVASGDTLVETLALLAPDTSSAILVRAEFVDSFTLRLDFDDALDPQDAQPDLIARVVDESTRAEIGSTAFAPHALQELLTRQVEDARAAADSAAAPDSAAVPDSAAAADSAAAPEPEDDPGAGLLGREAGEDAAGADSADADVTAAAPDSAGAVDRAAAGPGAGRGGIPLGAGLGAPPPPIEVPRGPAGEPLPTREWYLRLAAPLTPGAAYAVSVAGVRNVHGLGGGAGDARFSAPVPQPEEDAAETDAGDDTGGNGVTGDPPPEP